MNRKDIKQRLKKHLSKKYEGCYLEEDLKIYSWYTIKEIIVDMCMFFDNTIHFFYVRGEEDSLKTIPKHERIFSKTANYVYLVIDKSKVEGVSKLQDYEWVLKTTNIINAEKLNLVPFKNTDINPVFLASQLHKRDLRDMLRPFNIVNRDQFSKKELSFLVQRFYTLEDLTRAFIVRTVVKGDFWKNFTKT